MTFLMIIVALFIGVPIAEAIATRIKKGGQAANPDVEKALRDAEQRLAANETRLQALEERVDFYEKLLEAPGRSAEAGRLTPGTPRPLGEDRMNDNG